MARNSSAGRGCGQGGSQPRRADQRRRRPVFCTSSGHTIVYVRYDTQTWGASTERGASAASPGRKWTHGLRSTVRRRSCSRGPTRGDPSRGSFGPASLVRGARRQAGRRSRSSSRERSRRRGRSPGRMPVHPLRPPRAGPGDRSGARRLCRSLHAPDRRRIRHERFGQRCDGKGWSEGSHGPRVSWGADRRDGRELRFNAPTLVCARFVRTGSSGRWTKQVVTIPNASNESSTAGRRSVDCFGSCRDTAALDVGCRPISVGAGCRGTRRPSRGCGRASPGAPRCR